MSNTVDSQISAPILKVEQLNLAIGNHTLVSNISFSLFDSERVCLIGASGSGKSLTAKAITGTLPVDIRASGAIYVHSDEVSGLHASRRPRHARVSMVFQDSSTALNPLLSVGKQLSLALKTDNSSVIHTLIKKLKLDDIPDLLKRYPSELSGGQRQRICIALALIGKNRLLVADEPTSALDVISQQQVLQVLATRSKEPDAPALLFITHDIAVAAQLCQRGIVMEKGQIVESGSMQQLLHAPSHAYTKKLVSAARNAQQLLSANLSEALI